MNNLLQLWVEITGWSLVSTVISFIATVLVIRFVLGISTLADLITEVETDHNVAVGAIYAAVSFVASAFLGIVTTNGFTDSASFLSSIGWLSGGIVGAAILTVLVTFVMLNSLARKQGQTVLAYIRREIVEENNAALAFLLIGFAAPSFISVWFQVI